MPFKKNKKLLFVTGSRAEYGLAKATISRMQKSRKIDFRLLVTGMHTLKKYGYTLHQIQENISINSIIPISEDDDMLTALTKEIAGIKKYVQSEHIDAIMIAGDRDETFAAAIVGIHLNIPVIHVSGGDISGPSVDHYLRNATTIFSKLHLTQTRKAAANVIRLGADPKKVHIIGSMGLHNLNPSKLLSRFGLAKELRLDPAHQWYLITHHPTPFDSTSFKNQIESIVKALFQLDPLSDKIIIYPNSDDGSRIFISAIEKLRHRPRYHILKNLSHELYLALINQSEAMIGNSTAGLFEAGYLKRPFINVGNRQTGREKGVNVIDVPYDQKAIINAVQIAASKKFQTKLRHSTPIYRGGDVARKIIKAVEEFLYA